MKVAYPFSGIVGQDLLKTALLVSGVDQSVGGVLIRGDKGTAKSTAARALAELLPEIDSHEGCQFNCPIDAPSEICKVCGLEDRVPVQKAVPFVNLPIGATEDRVVGTLDLEAALKDGSQRLKPGLLAAAHRGILYVDEVNLLPDHLVDVLLDAAAMAQNTVQREGLSATHPARIALIGTMNPEEGDLRPQLLDRFGMMVEVRAPETAKERTEVVRRRLRFDHDGELFRSEWQTEQDQLRKQMRQARSLLPSIKLEDSLLALISTICCEMGIISLRADITMTKVVRALCALDGRTVPGSEDVRLAARLVLPHRRKTNPLDNGRAPQNDLDQITDDLLAPPPPPGNRPEESQGQNAHHSNDEEDDDDSDRYDSDRQPDSHHEDLSDIDDGEQFPAPEAGPGELVFEAALSELQTRIKLKERDSTTGVAGRRSTAANGRSGQYVRAVPDTAPTALAVDATVKHALLQQRDHFQITKNDLHSKVKSEKRSSLIILVVDASGSMSALKRMEAVKGAAIALLTDAYQKRDHVCVIAFKGERAEVLVSPTRSVQVVNEQLKALATGGRTPLAHSLKVALELAEKHRNNNLQPLIVVLTDGRGNVTDTPQKSPAEALLANASLIAEKQIPAIVVDTEEGYMRFGCAAELARTMGAEHICLDRMSCDSLTMTIRTHLHRGLR